MKIVFIGFQKIQIVFNILTAGRQNWLFGDLFKVGEIIKTRFTFNWANSP
jgi:hypothetical protein